MDLTTMEFGFWLRLEFVDGTKFLLCLRLRLQENDDTDLCGLLPGWSWAMRIQLEWASWKNRKEKRGERSGPTGGLRIRNNKRRGEMGR
jgi:hypothetical protein